MFKLLASQNPIVRDFINRMLQGYTFEYRIAQKYCWAHRGMDGWKMKEEASNIREFLAICKIEGVEVKVITRNEKYTDQNLEKVIVLANQGE
jgi:hypothetical protein